MTRISKSPVALESCGLAATAKLLGDRWTLLILRSVFYGVRRFADIKTDIAVPGSTLSARLKKLIDAGLLEERSYRDGNARTRKEYGLSPAGESLKMILVALMDWGDEHLRKGPAQLIPVARSTGQELEIAFVDRRGRAVNVENVDFKLRD